jgi:hypothetical protein
LWDPNSDTPVPNRGQFRELQIPAVFVGQSGSQALRKAWKVRGNGYPKLGAKSRTDFEMATPIEPLLLTTANVIGWLPGSADKAKRKRIIIGAHMDHLGLGTALMNQLKDDTKPTWKIGAEIRLAIGSIMKFDPMAPSANKGVSRGVQELKLWTSFARKLGWAEPWVELWWLVPIAEKSDALYTDPGFGATNTQPSQQAGVSSGVEFYALDNRADQTRISIDLGSKVTSHFEGREYTEMWEVFALAGDSRRMGPLILDSDPTNGSADPLSHPGISNIENYLELAGQFAVRAQIGPHVRFSVAANLIWKTDHAISFADAGVDNEDDNDLVNPGTDEVNPLHSQAIDLVGNRYRTDEGFDVVGIDADPRARAIAEKRLADAAGPLFAGRTGT